MSTSERRSLIAAVTVILIVSLATTSYADDLRVTNPGDTCIKYGTQTWYPVSYASGWYKYNINGSEVSARSGTHYLSDEQARQYGLSTGGNSGSTGTYDPLIITVKKANIKAGKKVKSAKAYKIIKKGKKIKIKVNKNKSGFTSSQIARAKKINNNKGWIALSSIDKYKRAKRTISLINDNTLPTEKRVRLTYDPPGWKNKKVKILGKKIWYNNRSHLVAFSLSGLNNEKKNLVTGAAKMNTPSMSDIEMKVLKYVRSTDNAVLYEVTPRYKGTEPVPRGIQIRYKSIDLGKPDNEVIEGNIYLYNRNPGWITNYKTGNFKKAS